MQVYYFNTLFLYIKYTILVFLHIYSTLSLVSVLFKYTSKCIIQIHFFPVYYSSTLVYVLFKYIISKCIIQVHCAKICLAIWHSYCLTLLNFSDIMSSRGPTHKRRKTKKEPNAAQVTPITSNPEGKSMQELAAALVPALIPAITQGVITTLHDLGVINKPQTQTQQNSAEQSNTSTESTTVTKESTSTVNTESSLTDSSKSPGLDRVSVNESSSSRSKYRPETCKAGGR